MTYRLALVGNPNSGKTTMFNEITGSNQYVGNWPGVTVEKKEGKAKKFNEDIRIIDLPGIYSLSPYSMEEIIARDYIIDEKPDVVINIVDATNIERNLYLTTQLLDLGIPVVVALNMMDAVEARGDKIDVAALEKGFGIPVIPVSANKGLGVYETVEKALMVAQSSAARANQVGQIVFDNKFEKYVEEVKKLISDIADTYGYNKRWVALKLIEKDEKLREKLNISGELYGSISEQSKELEKQYDMDIETIIADKRYTFITSITSKAVRKKGGAHNLTISDKIDKIVTHRVLAIPLFLLVMLGVFNLTFGAAGSFVTDWLDVLINETLTELLTGWLSAMGASDWLINLIIGGVFAGVGGMLVFVPQITIMFLFLSILEDSGYMARAAFIMDKLLRKLGLSGKSFIPMLMGFGCSVPAVMAARTLENEKDRRLTIILTPFMSCGARLPVYALFAGAFFAENQGAVVFSLYLLGIVVAVLSGILLKNTILKGDAAPFVMELPPYRFPTPKGLAIHMWDKIKGFLKKAGTVIFAASVIIWFSQSFNFSLQMVENPEASMFGIIGSIIAPIFTPLGFGDWRSSVALLTGFVAKEAVVATMGILYGLGEVGENSVELYTALQATFTPLKAYSFMTFTLLYMPCVAAFATIKREMNSWKWTLFAVGYQTGAAWIVAFIFYQVGRLMGLA